jgi:hypothetical protein
MLRISDCGEDCGDVIRIPMHAKRASSASTTIHHFAGEKAREINGENKSVYHC